MASPRTIGDSTNCMVISPASAIRRPCALNGMSSIAGLCYHHTMVETKPVFTLNARGNVFLEVMRSQFNLSSERMLKEIQSLRQMVVEALALKGLKYEDLKAALVPDQKRHEVALVFDTHEIDSNAYGYEVWDRLIPLLDRRSKHSMLVTDYSDLGCGQAVMFEAMSSAVVLARDVEWEHSSQFYIVYVTNVTESMIQRFHEGLSGWSAYIGYADATYESVFKLLLSMMAVNVCIKVGNVILQGHEDDVSNEEDCNMCGYPFEKNGFECRSIQSILEGTMLSFKIERPVIPGFEVDTEMSLNAVSEQPMPLDDFIVEVSDARLDYLRSAKAGSMERAGLHNMSASQLAETIRNKIAASYIYNMVHDLEHGVTKFNIIVEVPPPPSGGKPTRLLAALKYIPDRKTLELITLF